MNRLFLILLILAVLGLPSGVLAQDTAEGETPETEAVEGEQEGLVQEEEVELAPLHYILEPERDIWLGYRIVGVQGSNRALEYGWPHSSAAGGFKAHYSPLPYRLDVELEWLNKNDYRAEFSYAYKDILKLNYQGLGLWHNLDHFVPQPSKLLLERNPGWDYHVAVRDNRVFLRVKWPERPYHIFADYRQFEKEGTVQARFHPNALTGISKISRERDIFWITRRITAGFNGHFGPVEIEYSHMAKLFEPHGDVALADKGLIRLKTGDLLIHSVVPELETNSDTVKLHTDLTGRLVGAATLTNGEKKNNHSNTEVDFRRVFGDVTFIPFKNVTLAVKYRFKELEETVPAFVPQQTGTAPSPTPTKKPMDQRTNRAEVSLRYSPAINFALKAEYSFENIKRHDAKEWGELGITPFQVIPSGQNIHRVKLGVNSRPMRGVDFKGSMEYSYTGDPAYPIKPRNSFKGRFDGDWTPSTEFTSGAHFRFASEENGTANMSYRSDNIGAQVVWTPLERLYAAANYDYFRIKDVRDIQLTEGLSRADVPLPRERVPYRDSAHVYSIAAGYSFEFPVSLEAEYHQSFTRGMFRTRTTDGIVSASGIGELTDLKIRETGGALTVGYKFPKGWGSSVNYTVNDYQDLQDKPQDGHQDGTAHTILVMLTKKW